MRNGTRLLMTTMLCIVWVACGNQQKARQPAAESDASQLPGAGKSGPGVESTHQGIANLCDKLCQRAAEECTKQVAGLYEASCRRYLKMNGHCEKEVHRALECQLKAADDLLCAHQADPNCSQVNRELKICEHGSAPAEQTSAEDLTLPSGWSKVQDTQLGFTVAMPPGAALDAKSEQRTWQAVENGITYIVASIEPPPGKLNNQIILRTVIAYVGNRCQMRLKLHGQVEIKGITVVRYDSACPDGVEWHGMLHLWNGKAVSTGFHAPAGANGVLEPYFYSLQVAN